MAGQLPQPRVLPPQGRQVARRQAVHLEGREVHLRHGAGGARRRRQAAAEPAQGLVRQRRRHRGTRRLHRRVPAQAAPALAHHDAGLRLLAGLRRPHPAHAVPDGVRRHRALQGQGVAPRGVHRVREERRLLREGSALPRRAEVHHHQGARHPDGGAAGGSARHGPARRDHQGRGRAAQGRRAEDDLPAVQHQRHRQHHHEHEEATLRQPEGPAGGLLRHRPPRAHPGRPPGQRQPRRRHGAPAVRGVGGWPRRTSSRCPATARRPR